MTRLSFELVRNDGTPVDITASVDDAPDRQVGVLSWSFSILAQDHDTGREVALLQSEVDRACAKAVDVLRDMAKGG